MADERIIRVASAALFMGIFGLFLAGAYYFVSNKIPSSTILDTEVGRKSGLKTKVKNIRLLEKTKKNDILQLKAEEVEIMDNDTNMKNVHILYRRKDESDLELTAERGVMKNDTRSIILSGNVQLRSNKPLLLVTESLVWKPDERLLTSENDVQIETSFGFIKGKGLSVDVDKKILTILTSVEATFR